MQRRTSSTAAPPESIELGDHEEIDDLSLHEARADEELALEIAAAEAHRTAGELSLAAQCYRRVAQQLIDAGQDERAVSFARRASEMAALEHAMLPSEERTSQRAQGAATSDGAYDAVAHLPPWEQELSPGLRRGGSEPNMVLGRPGSAHSSSPAHGTIAGAASGTALPSLPSPSPRRSVDAQVSSSRDEELSTSARAPLRTSQGQLRIPIEADPSPLAQLVDEAVAGLTTPGVRSAAGLVHSRAPEPLLALRPSSSPHGYVPRRASEASRVDARLSVLPLFAELEADERARLAHQVNVVRFQRGEPLCEAGAPAGPLWILVEGVACVALPGVLAPSTLVSAGDFVGEMAALFGGPRTATVLAQEPIEAIALAPTLVRALARRYVSVRAILEETARERARDALPELCPLIRRLDAYARAELAALLEFRVLTEGEPLLVEGEPAVALCFVAAGEVELYGGTIPAARPIYARAGEVLGLTSTLSGEPAGLSARPLRDVLVGMLVAEAARAFAERHPQLLDALDDVSAPGRGVTC